MTHASSKTLRDHDLCTLASLLKVMTYASSKTLQKLTTSAPQQVYKSKKPRPLLQKASH